SQREGPGPKKLLPRLLAVARLADPDPWRNRFRQAEVRQSLKKLEQLAGEVVIAEQSPHILATLADLLQYRGGDGLAVLHAALLHYPNDVWLNYCMGKWRKDEPDRGEGYFQTVVALRPKSGTAYFNLGVALFWRHKPGQAIAAYQKAIEFGKA